MSQSENFRLSLTFVGQTHNIQKIEHERRFRIPEKPATAWVWGRGIYLGLTQASEKHYARLKLLRRGVQPETLDVVAEVSNPLEITLPVGHTWPPGGPNGLEFLKARVPTSSGFRRQAELTVDRLLLDAGFDALVIRPEQDIDCFWSQVVVFDDSKLSIVRRRASLIDMSMPARCDICWRPASTETLTCGSAACDPPGAKPR